MSHFVIMIVKLQYTIRYTQMRNYKNHYSFVYMLLMAGMTSTPLYAAISDVQRQQVVEQIKAGKAQTGLKLLADMVQKDPSNMTLLADYILLSKQYNPQASQQDYKLNHLNFSTYPVYGQLPLVMLLRDQGKFQLAEQYAAGFQKHSISDIPWNLYRGILLAEGGQAEQAKQRLKQVDQQKLNADQLAQLAYTYRLLGQPVQSLESAKKAMAISRAENVQEQYVLALAANADYDSANQFLQLNGKGKSQLKHEVQLIKFSQNIRHAIDFYRVQTEQDQGKIAYTQLDAVLAEMRMYEKELADYPELRQKFYYNYIYALSARQRSKEALAQLSKLNQPVEQMPAYARHALADSYLREHKPQQAEILYRSLFKEKNYVDYDVYAGLYYSLIEQEKFKAADALIEEMDQRLPVYFYSSAKGVDRQIHWDRDEFITLKGLHFGYKNQLDKAEQYFQNLVAKSPGNQSYLNSLATIQRWREKPLQAQATVSLLNGTEPVTRATRINSMENAQAITDVKTWRDSNTDLYTRAENDTGVIRSHKELRDRDRFTISHNSLYAKSDADEQNEVNNLNGAREKQSWTRLNTPWFSDYFRSFVEHQYRSGEYEEGDRDDQRIGLGLEWANKRKYATVAVSQATEGDRFGVNLTWNHWLDDHWNYGIGYNSQADIPLQIQDEHEGQSYRFDLNWQKHESTKAGLSYQFTDIDDGNERQELGTYFKQRIFQSPHHLTHMNLYGFWAENKDIETAYFNPSSSWSAEVGLEHDWITWRSYDQSLTQRFSFNLGVFDQEDYDAGLIYLAKYQHLWKITRTWSLNYGVSYGQHPYDGEDENRLEASFGFEGRF
ncbi:poly-beta-1,6 N-acetyl-D-glucosamine export porin PgaA [Acinetobacter sp. HR7]|uniref:poly-beta-1,6 N-acetyl-D-glucosamine export porin PgaA n=1 Tax=Acinetobacter sp. HR7 TaxID=1509403 RepID=UPI001D0D67BF|nr:poly-beta-1,6 N-acetyl-D-glucosamine export porin PgaA [Acinetobacter sp. HR7]